MIQIIDISQKILYDELQAEKSLLTLINAAVSHELRNPLNSLIGQIIWMDEHILNFNKIINFLNDKQYL